MLRYAKMTKWLWSFLFCLNFSSLNVTACPISQMIFSHVIRNAIHAWYEFCNFRNKESRLDINTYDMLCIFWEMRKFLCSKLNYWMQEFWILLLPYHVRCNMAKIEILAKFQYVIPIREESVRKKLNQKLLQSVGSTLGLSMYWNEFYIILNVQLLVSITSFHVSKLGSISSKTRMKHFFLSIHCQLPPTV